MTETAAEQDKKAARHSMDPIDPSLYEYFGGTFFSLTLKNRKSKLN